MNKVKLQSLLALVYYGSIIAESSADLLQTNQTNNDNIRILGLFDTENWEWGEELFNYTMQMINDPSSNWPIGTPCFFEKDRKTCIRSLLNMM